MSEKTSARSMAFDAEGVPYVFVRSGNEHYLTRLGADDRLEVVRSVSKGFWWFRIDNQQNPGGLFEDDDHTIPIAAYALVGEGRARKVEIEGETRFYSWHRSACTCDGLYAIGASKGPHIYRLQGAGGVNLDKSPTAQTTAETGSRFYLAGHDGLYSRSVGVGAAGKWRQLAGGLERCKQLIYDPVHDQVVVVGTYQGTGKVHLISPDGAVKEHASPDGHGYWSAACLDGRLYVFADTGVIELQQDGKATACGVTGENVRNQCLFAGGGALYFVCANRIHRLRDSRWSVIDLAGQTLKVRASKAPKHSVQPSRPAAPLNADASALMARVVDNFDDLEALHVLADALQGARDPRGELIELQCIEQPTAAQRRRIEALLKAHLTEWLGPLADTAARGSVVFRRGFLRELGLKQKAASKSKQLRGQPQWATVERLDVSMWPDVATLELICDPGMKCLRIVDGLNYGVSLALVGTPAWHTLALRFGLRPDDIATLCNAGNLPALHHLTFDAQDVDQTLLVPLWRCPLIRQLETLVVRCRQLAGVVPLWNKELGHLQRLTILPGGMDRAGGWQLTLQRERGALQLRFQFHWANHRDLQFGKLADLMRALPPLSATAGRGGIGAGRALAGPEE
jgi:hypothetical protein